MRREKGRKKDRKRREKGWKKGEKGEKVTERKMVNMHLLKAVQARSTCGVKIGGKRARRARKVTERKRAISIY
jgi:hypothetical protein